MSCFHHSAEGDGSSGGVLPLKRLSREEEAKRDMDRDTEALLAAVRNECSDSAAALECIIVILELCSPSRCCRIWIVRM